MTIYLNPQPVGGVWTFTINNGVVTTVPSTASESPPTPVNPCSFCGEPTGVPPDGKHGWHVCPSKYCLAASQAQGERMYAGLFDSPETRLSALNWVKSRG